jgi:hypothetical protein
LGFSHRLKPEIEEYVGGDQSAAPVRHGFARESD